MGWFLNGKRRPEIPIGGTTGLDLWSCDGGSFDEGAQWFAQSELTCPRPIIPNFRRMFGLTVGQACEALREANRRCWRGGA